MRHVDLLLFGSRPGFAEAVGQGVAEVGVRRHGWSLQLRQARREDAAREVAASTADGFVATIPDGRVARAVLRGGRPAVNLVHAAAARRDPALASVLIDDVAVGHLAARHLLDGGAAALAYVGVSLAPEAMDRLAGFLEVAAAAGSAIHVLRRPGVRPAGTSATPAGLSTLPTWFQATDPKFLAPRLAVLPRPLGVLGFNDQVAAAAVDAALSIGLDVPQDVAVVGVDDVALICRHHRRPISSVPPDHAAMGRLAASMLADLFAGRRPEPPQRLVAPRPLVVRRSSDRLPFADARLNAALRHLRAEAGGDLTVDAVAARAGVSRSTLDRAFAGTLGHSPADELRRARIDLAKRLLRRRPPLSLYEVADRSGLGSASFLCQTFRRHVGQSPAAFRRAAG